MKLGALKNFKVAFKGVKNYQYQWKYVALDDISFMNCQAPQDLGPGECHFEDGMCGFRDEKIYDDFDWVRHKGRVYYLLLLPRCCVNNVGNMNILIIATEDKNINSNYKIDMI